MRSEPSSWRDLDQWTISEGGAYKPCLNPRPLFVLSNSSLKPRNCTFSEMTLIVLLQPLTPGTVFTTISGRFPSFRCYNCSFKRRFISLHVPDVSKSRGFHKGTDIWAHVPGKYNISRSMTWKHSSPEEDTAKIKEYRETRAPFVVLLNPAWSEEMWTATPFVTIIKCNTAATIMNLWVSSKGQLLLPCKFQLSVLLLCFDRHLLFITVGSRGADCPLWISDTFNIDPCSESRCVCFSNHQTWSQLRFKWHSNQNQEANPDVVAAIPATVISHWALLDWDQWMFPIYFCPPSASEVKDRCR